jgi:hypothetical protein
MQIGIELYKKSLSCVTPETSGKRGKAEGLAPAERGEVQRTLALLRECAKFLG